MTRGIVAFVGLLLLSSLVFADRIKLKNGAEFEGQIVSETDKVVVFKIRGLGPQTFKRTEVVTLTRCKSIFDEYEERRDALESGDSEGVFNLALWCMEHGLRQEARKAYRSTISIDSDHAGSRQALGYSKIRDRWLSRVQVKRYREQRRRDIEKVLGGLKLGDTVKDKENRVSLRPPRGWKPRPVDGDYGTLFEGPHLHGVNLCLGYEVGDSDELEDLRARAMADVRSRHEGVEDVKSGSAASLGGEMATEDITRYPSGEDTAERHDIYLKRESSVLHAWFVCPAEDFDALRQLFSNVCSTFKEITAKPRKGPFQYDLPGPAWKEGFGLPEGMEHIGLAMPDMPPGVKTIHNTEKPVIVWMIRQHAEGASMADPSVLRDGFFEGFSEAAGAPVTPQLAEEESRKVAGQRALVTPYKGRGGAISYFEGYLCSLIIGDNIYMIFCWSLEGQMDRKRLKKDFMKLLDSFSV